MTESPEELAAVEQLLTERDAVYGWMARLDQAPIDAPESVRARVRGDYQRRLDQITAGLRAHIDVVSARLAGDREEHDGLVARATAAREALAEAELRHMVGEYDDTRFEAERSRYGGEIESLDVAAAAISERIDRLEEVQTLADRAPGEPPVPSHEAEPDLAGYAEPGEVVAVVEEEIVAIDELSPESEQALAIFDEAAEAAATGHDEEAPRAPADLGPLTFRPSGSAPEVSRQRPAPRAPTFETAPPLGIPAADVPPRFVRPGERIRPVRPVAATVPPVAEAPPAGDALLDQEIVSSGPLPDAPAVPVGRTLRCGECGAMNRPLEWYCEKCGAELTAV